jgi:hypothetical protein
MRIVLILSVAFLLMDTIFLSHLSPPIAAQP